MDTQNKYFKKFIVLFSILLIMKIKDTKKQKNKKLFSIQNKNCFKIQTLKQLIINKLNNYRLKPSTAAPQ